MERVDTIFHMHSAEMVLTEGLLNTTLAFIY